MTAVLRPNIGHELRVMVWDRTGGQCYFCGCELDWYEERVKFRPHVDHLHPVSRGGGNDLDNLAMACPKCNMGKGGLTAEEFRTRTGILAVERLEWLIALLDLPLDFLPENVAEAIRRLRQARAVLASPAFYGELLERAAVGWVI